MLEQKKNKKLITKLPFYFFNLQMIEEPLIVNTTNSPPRVG